ncbi:PhzF family phenazine biosynthesis protein [Massilia yuzhufengensis]|uniref:Phenazine biosynthesis protein PhzF family n=1 Tax=Massilia yuzhufengensis TaxID=1164594 RepID=A0A1I1HQA4_9BURK|nr:PhzF family phenazine biosynthesis protein [Massilia yuzhufengensis]SFC23180.1 phenazine biosynthesis protein PhzF family [Massilia yuzhufengensis]
MARLPFKTVDVFTTVPFKGNPVAVVLDAGGLTAGQMQHIASWTKLSETTFVFPATADGADYHVRIFTPGAELPFAGHPTIGTVHALLEAGVVQAKDGVLVQQCGAGLVTLRVEAGEGAQWISFELPTPGFTELDAGEVVQLESILRADLEVNTAPYLVDVGARWVVAQLTSARAVLACEPDLQRMKAQDVKGRHTGVIIFGQHDAGGEAGIEVRAFAPAHGIDEDPVCGSGTGAVAAYLRHTGQLGEFGRDFLATQGEMVGRAGTLRLSISDKAIHVGGNAITCVDGSLFI